MNKRNRAAWVMIQCIITVSLISLFIKEVCNIQVQTSFLVDKENEKVVLVIADYVELEDFAENNYLSRLFNNSCVAFISGRQSGKASAVKAKLAIGSGRRLEIDPDMKRASQQDKIAYEDIYDLKALNENNEYLSHIGYLGSELRRNNKRVSMIGNSDTETEDRSSVLLGMDDKGLVDLGDIENTLLIDNSFPGAKRTDYDKLFEKYSELISISDLMIVDIGDLARLEYYKDVIGQDTYDNHKKTIIIHMEQFMKKIIQSTPDTTFVLFSTYPSRSDMKGGFKLTPILIHNARQSGLIYSDSTKRDGIIISTDIPDFIVGRLAKGEENRLHMLQEPFPLKSMLTLKRKLLSISTMRLPVLTWYAILEIFCAVIGFLYMLNSDKKRLSLDKYVKIVMLANIVAPAVLLYMAVLDMDDASLYLMICILLSLFIAGFIYLCFRSSSDRFLGAALFVNLSIAADLFRGSTLIKSSIFGYDPIIGARFYGIGNEFAGVFIGSGLLLAGCLYQHCSGLSECRPKTISAVFFAYTLLQLSVIGMPFLGANFGGVIAAVVGYYFFFCSVRQQRINISKMITLFIGLALTLCIIIIYDISNTSNKTHIGRFISDIQENGLKVLYSTITRKAAMNLRLMKYTIWTKVLLCIILIITIMFFKPVRLLHNIFKKYKFFTAAWVGISAASIAGLAVNDSGIVMAATAMIFTGYTILYICLEEMETEN